MQALSTCVSSVQPVPPYLAGVLDKLLKRREDVREAPSAVRVARHVVAHHLEGYAAVATLRETGPHNTVRL
jgi:hypothetical protein